MKKLALLLALFCIIGFGATANAIGISINVGDQPYYVRGPGYWDRGAYYVWIPGHYCGWRHHHRIWCHGHYAVR